MIGERIAFYRKERGMTQTELAARIEVKPQAVSAWEKKGIRPSADKIQKIAKVLGITTDVLLEDKKIVPVQMPEQEPEKRKKEDADVEAALRLRRERPEILKLIASDGYTDEQIRAIAEVLRKTK